MFSERAWKALEPLIGASVEALPIKHPSQKPYYAMNVLEVDFVERSAIAGFFVGKLPTLDRALRFSKNRET
ncbi:MAG TPA: hypothetical protein VGI40_04575 [Pirellulaceae bacterium]